MDARIVLLLEGGEMQQGKNTMVDHTTCAYCPSFSAVCTLMSLVFPDVHHDHDIDSKGEME